MFTFIRNTVKYVIRSYYGRVIRVLSFFFKTCRKTRKKNLKKRFYIDWSQLQVYQLYVRNIYKNDACEWTRFDNSNYEKSK